MNGEPQPETQPFARDRGRRGWIRRMYDWTLSWAEHPAGAWALFVIAFAESSFFPVPPDVLLLALCAGAIPKSFQFALICSVGSVLGGMLGYGIGLWGYETIGEPIVKAYHGEEVMNKIQLWYDRYGFWGILAAAITPIPYKVFTIASGVFRFPFLEFMVASVLGRSFRFFAVAALMHVCGAKVKMLVEKYFNWFSWAFFLLLILGFIVIKWLS